MKLERYEADLTTANERASSDKSRSLRSLILGARAKQFHAFLPQLPTSDELTAIAEKLNKPRIDHVVLGRLAPPHMPMPAETIERLRAYSEQGRKVVFYPDNSYSDQLIWQKDSGVSSVMTCIDKPSLRGFEYVCDRQKIDPAHTAAIVSSPITDIPLVGEGEDPFFPLNVLVRPTPPQKKLIASWGKYFRSRLSYTFDLATTSIVRLRNPDILREINPPHAA